MARLMAGHFFCSNPTTLLRAIRVAATQAAPREVCGLLLGHDRIETHQQFPNIATEPGAFEIDPLMYAACERALRPRRILGVYHSHVGPPVPSVRDQNLLWPAHSPWQLIVSVDGHWNLWRPGPHRWARLDGGRC